MTDDLRKIIEYTYRAEYNKELELELIELDVGYARTKMSLKPKHMNAIETCHGGAIFSMCDTTASTAATTRGRFPTTINSNINYLRPVHGSKVLYAKAIEIKVGKSVGVYDVEVSDEKGTVVTLAEMTVHFLADDVNKAIIKKLLECIENEA